MGLFGIGKKEDKKPRMDFERLPPLPEFPSAEQEVADLPSYEPSISDLKREVDRTSDIDIPVRERKVTPVFSQNTTPQVDKFTNNVFREEKPLFIKIDKYKEALRAIDTLKAKLMEAEKVLKSLEDIRDEENHKLEAWKSELETVKSKLLTIDQSLFEP